MACNDYGFSQRGHGDQSRTIEAYKKACSGGLARGCLNLGLLYSELKKSSDSMIWFAQACNRGDVNGCDLKELTEASELAAAHKPAEAAVIMARFCSDTRKDGCVDLGLLALEMDDKTRASRAFLDACHSGSDDGCAKYGEQELNQGRASVAMEFCAKACKASRKDGCDCAAKAKKLIGP